MNTRRVREIVALISVAVATLAGCAPTPAPTSPTPTPTQSTPAPQEYELEVFWASNQPTDIRLASETVTISTTTTPLDEVLGQIVDGTLQPADPDYVNLWGSGSQLTSLTIDGSRATIDVAEPNLNVGATGEFRALQQLMFTVAAAEPDVTEFSFLVNGQTVETLAGHIDLTTPLTTGDPNEALLAVQIDSPSEDAAASNPVTVRGEACVFEANVAWELTQGGSTIDSGSTMAAEACPTRSEWTLELGELEPGDYVIVVREMSAKDGSVVTEDSTRFTVQ
jgi:hypothetical protein